MNAMASDTGSDTDVDRNGDWLIRSATAITYCWMDSTWVPLSRLPSSPSQISTYTRPTSTGRRVSRLSAMNTAVYAIAPSADATASATANRVDPATRPIANIGT